MPPKSRTDPLPCRPESARTGPVSKITGAKKCQKLCSFLKNPSSHSRCSGYRNMKKFQEAMYNIEDDDDDDILKYVHPGEKINKSDAIQSNLKRIEKYDNRQRRGGPIPRFMKALKEEVESMIGSLFLSGKITSSEALRKELVITIREVKKELIKYRATYRKKSKEEIPQEKIDDYFNKTLIDKIHGVISNHIK